MLLISSILLTQCNNFIHDLIPREDLSTSNVPSQPSYTVTFNKNNTDPGSTEATPPIKTVTVPAATVNPLPRKPFRLGWAFDGWWTKDGADGAWGDVFDETDAVTANITVYAKWNQLTHYFTFTVRTKMANEDFAIPTSGRLNGGSNDYNWYIDWDDNTASEPVGSAGVVNRTDGIPHTYPSPGDYHITITPAGSADAWLGAFGFSTSSSGSDALENRDKVISVDSPLTLLMTRTQAQISGADLTVPSNEWMYTFYRCQNLTMGTQFKFAAEWDTIKTVGDNFASSMFGVCYGAAFTMNDVFNLPQGIKTVGIFFADSMFKDCNGSGFRVNTVFKFPRLNQTELNKSGVYGATFYLGTGAAAQTRTVASIIGGNPDPSADKNTFGPDATVWNLTGVHANWKQ